ncbi:MAG: putative DNA modification/repair radical SAM protein, partial [Eubacteriaceae bacterium]|nr:putative DNA modification/repair radical SAM protein [Eubacteriaceae bacterium]
EKLEILSDAAKYDASCASSYTQNSKYNSIRAFNSSGICHTYTQDGRCVSLLKVLFTNKCTYNCIYCINKVTNDCRRASFTSEELATLTYEFYRRNYISGLFLSSAVEKSPNYTQQNIYKTILLLRTKYSFKGYIHAKAIAGADLSLIQACGYLADRMSINIELPSRQSLKLLAPQKSFEEILKPIDYISKQSREFLPLNNNFQKSSFLPGGQSTQMIIGASDDDDYQILKTSKFLYKKMNLSRVTYSAYIPVCDSSLLPSISTKIPLKRENRLYQADWLMRYYYFDADELICADDKNLDLNIDPKTNWALNNFGKFPIEVNNADYKTLLRIPGIGRRSAANIVRLRDEVKIDFDVLKQMGVVLKRAKYFITANGKNISYKNSKPEDLKELFTAEKSQQLSFFDNSGVSYDNRI